MIFTASQDFWTRLPRFVVMEPAAEGRLPQPFVKTSRLLSVPSELRIQIYREIFRGLEARLIHPYDSRAYSTLVAISRVCRTFLVEARPLFLRTVTFFVYADVFLSARLARLSLDDYLLIRKVTVFVSRFPSSRCSLLPHILPNLEQLNIDLAPCYSEYLDIENAMKSKDTVVITDTIAEYDLERIIWVTTCEDWVGDLAIEHVSGDSLHKFKLLIRLDFINTLHDGCLETTVVGGAG